MLEQPQDYDSLGVLVAAVADAMDVQSVRRPGERQPGRAPGAVGVELEIAGRLRLPADEAYERISARFRSLGHVPLFRRARDGDLVLAIRGSLPTQAGRDWVALVLLLATMASVLWTGAMLESGPDGEMSLLAGVPFMASFLAILTAHEMGHYLMARRLGTPASLPYFIPLPLFSVFGTMGAVMQMNVPPRDRRALLRIGAAGPLAGLVVALPVLVVGLLLSEVRAIPLSEPTMQEGNSLLYLGIKYLLFGQVLPSGGVDVFLHSVALAGWGGVLVTAFNLIPAGQLDGGHILYALLGERARHAAWIIIAALVGLSLIWQWWLLWAGIVFVFGRMHAVPLNDISELSPRERAAAVLMLILAVLLFVPVPLAFSFPT